MLSHNVNHDPGQWQRTANQDASKIHEICWNFPRIWSTTLTSTTLGSLTSLPFTTLWRKNLAIRCPWITIHLVETWHKYVSRIQKIISRMRSGLSVKTQKVGAISNFGEDVRPQIIFVIKEIASKSYLRVIKQLGTQIIKWLLRFELSNCNSLKYNIDAGLFSVTWKWEGKTTDCTKNGGQEPEIQSKY